MQGTPEAVCGGHWSCRETLRRHLSVPQSGCEVWGFRRVFELAAGMSRSAGLRVGAGAWLVHTCERGQPWVLGPGRALGVSQMGSCVSGASEFCHMSAGVF